MKVWKYTLKAWIIWKFSRDEFLISESSETYFTAFVSECDVRDRIVLPYYVGSFGHIVRNSQLITNCCSPALQNLSFFLIFFKTKNNNKRSISSSSPTCHWYLHIWASLVSKNNMTIFKSLKQSCILLYHMKYVIMLISLNLFQFSWK